MRLNIQIYSLIYSFFFGIVFYFLLDLFNKMNIKFVLKAIVSFFFIITLSILYFLGLLYINNGYLHVYFFLSIMVGYGLIYLLRSFWFTRYRRK